MIHLELFELFQTEKKQFVKGTELSTERQLQLLKENGRLEFILKGNVQLRCIKTQYNNEAGPQMSMYVCMSGPLMSLLPVCSHH